MMKVKRTDLGSAWLQRHGLEEDQVLDGGWAILVILVATCVVPALVCTLVWGASVLPFVVAPAFLAPLIGSAVYLNAPESFAASEERSMLRESPAAIGRMAMSLHVQPSLERAVVFSSRNGEGVLDGRLREAMWFALTRTKANLNEAVLDLSSSLSETNASLRQSLHLIISATCERTQEGMRRLLDKANSVALSGIRDAVDRYVSSLSVPTMVLFSLGTLLPIMLFSVLPLLSIGTAVTPGQASDPIPLPYLSILLLVVLPGAALVYSWMTLSRNPLGLTRTKTAELAIGQHLPFITVWAACAGLVALLAEGELGPFILSGTIVLAPCAYIVWAHRGQGNDQKKRAKMEVDATNALFIIGNRMVSGSTLEDALVGVAGAKQGGYPQLIRTTLHRSRMNGKGLDQTFIDDGTLRSLSPMLENAYVTVVQCSRQDPRYAGQVALNLAQMLTDLDACKGKIEEKLRGIMDMMRSTAMVFAPIVLGVTGSLFSLINGQVSGGGMADDVALITGIYIGELSFLVSFFTVMMMGERSWRGVMTEYAVRTPVAFSVYVIVSLICRTGLTALL